MDVAMIGMGKLGCPVSCAMVQKGHKVYGYDIVPELREQLKLGKSSLYEPDIERVLQESLKTGLTICDTVKDAMEGAEIIFVAVPTPSLPDDSFDTSYVKDTLREIVKVMEEDEFLDYKVISIISTVLPGTVRNEFLPILQTFSLAPWTWGLCYNAQFIAMGTTVYDMLNPEFVLIGELDQRSGDVLGSFYSQLVDAPLLRMSIESAETVKMAYNTMIGFKIVYGNALMELCDKVPFADCDEVYGAISKANKRLLSPRYMKGGMGDGGGCLPIGELIMTEKGRKPIGDISVDDKVLTVDGSFQKVLGKWERKYSGNLIVICSFGATVRFTEDHKMIATNKAGMCYDKNSIVKHLDDFQSVASEVTEELFVPYPLEGETYWHKIDDVWNEPYTGKVYNLWVAGNNTYVTSIGAVKNCHPRDNRALSYLANKLKLSTDPFEFVMEARNAQSRELAQVILKTGNEYHLPLAIMGLTFKPETNLTLDSPSYLLIEHLYEIYLQPAYTYDPIIKPKPLPACPKIYVLCTRHAQFLDYPFEEGSVIIDPWRMFDKVPSGCIYRPIGK